MMFDLPDSLKIEEKSIGSIISISTIIGLILSLLSFFKFDSIDMPYRIIIILSILLFIAIVDIVILYVRDREKQYFQCYLNSVYKDLGNKLETYHSNTSKVSNELLNFKKELSKTKLELQQNLKLND